MRRAWLAVAMAAWVCVAAAAPTALAQGPAWRVASVANTTAAPGGTLQYLLEAQNVGAVDSTAPADPTCDPNTPPVDSACVTFTATLPAGLTGVGLVDQGNFHGANNFSSARCVGLNVPGPTVITCTTAAVFTTIASSSPLSVRGLMLTVAVDPGASGTLTTTFDVSGGGAATAGSTVDPTRISLLPPAFGIDAFDAQASDSAGNGFSQAGGHPYAASTSIDFNTLDKPNALLLGAAWPVEATKDVLVDLPPGFVGNPTVAERCTASELASADGRPFCPPSSQVGTTVVRVDGLGFANNIEGPLPVFNMVPPPGVPARFGFNVVGSLVTLDAHLRSGTDYGLSANVLNVPEGLDVAGTSLTLWGVPADAAHDGERACPGDLAPSAGGATCLAGVPSKAFLRNPTSCSASPGSSVSDGLVTGLHIDSWVNPGPFDADGNPDLSDPRWQSATTVSHDPPGYPAAPSDWGARKLPTGCDSVPFDPKLTAAPAGAAKAGSPSGFTFDVKLPQSDEPSAIGEGDLKKAVVTLPAGVRVSPASADGLKGCTPDQIGLHSTDDATCPDGSKVGSLTIKTPLLEEPLTGSVYLATPHDNPFGSLIATYLVAKGPGVIVKIAGKVESDGGRLTATFDDNPQVPFSNLHLEFDGGARAPLVTPKECGTYTTHAELTSWSGKVVESDSSFTLDTDSDGGSCAPSRFSPAFSAGTVDAHGVSDSTFTLSLTRSDKDRELRFLGVNMPVGLVGRVANTTLCSDSAATVGTCGDGSKLGSVTVGAGAGPSPFFITNGRAYITGPYKGARLGLSIVVPAVAGPFDLGNVVVRAAIFVDKHTSALRVVSDPLPTILEGIPLDVRDVRVLIDRPKFIVNPTSCATKQVVGTIGSVAGDIVRIASRFRATDCATLPVAPKLAPVAGAKGRTKAGVSTPFTATLTQTPGQSNLRSVSVSLPTTLNALLPVVNRACKLVEFNAGTCSNTTRVGSAVAVTPLLRDPLKGSAYFVKNPSRAIPDLMIALKGQVDFDLVGKVTIPGGKHLATTFDAIPDVPITKFTLRLVSGKNGPLGTAANLCTAKSKAATAAVVFTGQNGKVLRVNQRLRINGCPKAKKANKAKR